MERGTSLVDVPAPASNGQTRGDGGSADWELFLLRLRYREGQLIAVAGNRPVLLDDPGTVWVVFSGHVEVYAVRTESGQATGARRHLFRADTGVALLGMDLQSPRVGLLASGVPGTQLVRVERASLARLAAAPEFAPLVATLIERWVDRLSSSLVRDLPPRDIALLEAGQTGDLSDGAAARPRTGLLWIRQDEGRSRYLGQTELPSVASGDVVPLSARAWLQADGQVRVSALDTGALLAGPGAWVHVDHFHALVLAGLTATAEERLRAERERHAARDQADRSQREAAFGRLAHVAAPRASGRWAAVEGSDPLLAACRLVGEALDIPIKSPRRAAGAVAGDAPLQAIARASSAQTRRVALRGAWWKSESGPLVGYRELDQRPVALLPEAGGYQLYDPVDRASARVTTAVAATLAPHADTIYRRFGDRPLTAASILAFGLHGAGRDLSSILALGFTMGLLGLLTPVVTGALFDLVIPGAHRSLLLQLGAGLAIAAVSAALFQVARDVAVLRLSGRIQAAVEPAIMDRLLDLPATFFRRYTAGDLSGRVLAISAMRETLTGPVLSALLSSIFTLFNVVLLFIYDARLALVAVGLIFVLVVVFAVSSYLQVRYQRLLGERAGRLAGTVVQLINGIPKLRAAGAEGRAFAFWAERFAQQREVAYQARRVNNGLAVFNATYPLVTSIVVFGLVAVAFEPAPALGVFLAFNAAFGQLIGAAVGLIQASTTLYQAVPAYERARPLLQIRREVDESRADPGELSGAIELDHVSFRYGEDGPPVLNDVSLQCQPGEFVALVGPSGSGKSTLLRLLLGLEVPESGAIRYDRRDLATLDARAVRRQIGTVLQDGRLLAGDLFTNIVGASTLTLDDAWAAARQAGLDEDIRHLPMGMYTVLSDGASTLSGGQRQRLLIARAIVHKPRLLLFDEATSALDNRTQENVSESLERLAVTRVVIAHRLSTILKADRIYVLERGRIVEIGTYRELVQRRGVFAALARRQVA
jgi:NHLM bacteriocin system ABC transporter ATP-binding protein